MAGVEFLPVQSHIITHRIHGNDLLWFIYLHEWLISMVNVGKDTSPMDPMGNVSTSSRSEGSLEVLNFHAGVTYRQFGIRVSSEHH